MNKSFVIAITFLAGFFGFLFFLVQGQYIVIKLPWFSFPRSENMLRTTTSAVSREIICHLWGQNASMQIKKNILWPQSNTESIKRVVVAWIDSAINENIIADDVKVVSVALTQQSTVALISFNKSFILSELATCNRWQLVESLLQTLRGAGIVLEGVYFLQGQHFLQDDYLDFSQRWPISGYRS